MSLFDKYPDAIVRNATFIKYIGTLHVIWREYFCRSKIRKDNFNLEKIGSDYGGFLVPGGMIDENWIIYSAGVGEDITFDLGLINQFGCNVFAFDPTPRAINYVRENEAVDDQFHFLPLALWNCATTLKFYAPANPNHVSHSIVNMQATAQFFRAKCDSLQGLMKHNGHKRIHLLKLNIEGAEYEVLDDLLKNSIGVRVLCVAFDQPMPIWRTHQMVNRLLAADYALVGIDGWKFTFVSKGNLPG